MIDNSDCPLQRESMRSPYMNSQQQLKDEYVPRRIPREEKTRKGRESISVRTGVSGKRLMGRPSLAHLQCLSGLSPLAVFPYCSFLTNAPKYRGTACFAPNRCKFVTRHANFIDISWVLFMISSGFKILLVEDHDDIREFLRMDLEKSGYSVTA